MTRRMDIIPRCGKKGREECEENSERTGWAELLSSALRFPFATGASGAGGGVGIGDSTLVGVPNGVSFAPVFLIFGAGPPLPNLPPLPPPPRSGSAAAGSVAVPTAPHAEFGPGPTWVFGPLYRDFWYFSASEIHCVWVLYSAGVWNVVEQSMQSKPEWQRVRCWSSLGFFMMSPQPVWVVVRYG